MPKNKTPRKAKPSKKSKREIEVQNLLSEWEEQTKAFDSVSNQCLLSLKTVGALIGQRVTEETEVTKTVNDNAIQLCTNLRNVSQALRITRSDINNLKSKVSRKVLLELKDYELPIRFFEIASAYEQLFGVLSERVFTSIALLHEQYDNYIKHGTKVEPINIAPTIVNTEEGSVKLSPEEAIKAQDEDVSLLKEVTELSKAVEESPAVAMADNATESE